ASRGGKPSAGDGGRQSESPCGSEGGETVVSYIFVRSFGSLYKRVDFRRSALRLKSAFEIPILGPCALSGRHCHRRRMALYVVLARRPGCAGGAALCPEPRPSLPPLSQSTVLRPAREGTPETTALSWAACPAM